MTPGNPELVIEDGWLVRKFIDDFLSGGNVDVRCGERLHRLSEVHSEIGDDGFPWLTGWVLDADYEYMPMGNAMRHSLSIPWESITRLEL